MQRTSASHEILDFSMMEYIYAFLLPCFTDNGAGIASDEELFARADLRSLTERLEANDKARVITSANDVLLSPEDLSWLSEVFGEDRLVIHPEGGHLGHLAAPEVRASIRAALEHIKRLPDRTLEPPS